jgi:hypothetical protein
MPYRANVTDKEQSDIERQEDSSAIRIQWWKGTDGQTSNEGETKVIKAYDTDAQDDVAGSPSSDVLQVSRPHMVIGSHNDKPYRFSEPGKA